MIRRMRRDVGRLFRSAALLSVAACAGGSPGDVADGTWEAEAARSSDAKPLPQIVTSGNEKDWVDETGYGGGACRGAVNIFSDRHGMQMFFTDFKLQRETGEVQTSKTGQCYFFLKLSGGRETQVAVRGISLLGSSYVPTGSRASFVVKYGNEYASVKPSKTLPTWSGPTLGTWHYSFDDVQSEWSPCGRAARLDVVVQLALDGPAFSSMKVSNVILNVEQRACTQ